MSDEDRGTVESTDDEPDTPMTDHTDDEFEQADVEDRDTVQETDTAAGVDAQAADGESDRRIDGDLRRKLNYALLFGLGFLALVAVVQFYLNMSAVINQWVTREFRSLFQAVFNLVVLLVVGAAISRQVKRLAN